MAKINLFIFVCILFAGCKNDPPANTVLNNSIANLQVLNQIQLRKFEVEHNKNPRDIIATKGFFTSICIQKMAQSFSALTLDFDSLYTGEQKRVAFNTLLRMYHAKLEAVCIHNDMRLLPLAQVNSAEECLLAIENYLYNGAQILYFRVVDCDLFPARWNLNSVAQNRILNLGDSFEEIIYFEPTFYVAGIFGKTIIEKITLNDSTIIHPTIEMKYGGRLLRFQPTQPGKYTVYYKKYSEDPLLLTDTIRYKSSFIVQ